MKVCTEDLTYCVLKNMKETQNLVSNNFLKAEENTGAEAIKRSVEIQINGHFIKV